MIKVIVGEKGSGKTKALLDSVHAAMEKDMGSVVFINNNKRHVLDLNYKIRMIDTSEFEISAFDELYGLLCGIVSQDYDTTNIFVDSITKIADGTDESSEICGSDSGISSPEVSLRPNMTAYLRRTPSPRSLE